MNNSKLISADKLSYKRKRIYVFFAISALIFTLSIFLILISNYIYIPFYIPYKFTGYITDFKNDCAADAGSCYIKVNDTWIDFGGASSGFPPPGYVRPPTGKLIDLTFSKKYLGKKVEVYAKKNIFQRKEKYATLVGNKNFYIKLLEK